ncbi:MAG: dTDP-4-dehydrorhamnose 3,5-epimerase family protein, partial [Nanoarchaeota archaeon]|nr:dTDP-4-dehydrorhamnose 3,5-epimerase family protein [Nanoarchaeota archaeon]
SEIYRKDENNFQASMSYVSFSNYNKVRGPHEHKYQSDFFVFIGPGDFEFHMWDNRAKSETYNQYKKLIVGESKKVSILVPPGIVHGYKSISKKGSFSINLPDKLYKEKKKKGVVDEIRYEKDKNSSFKIR